MRRCVEEAREGERGEGARKGEALREHASGDAVEGGAEGATR